MEGIRVAPEVRRGRNQLAATVVVGHAVKHIYNAGLQSVIMTLIKIDLGLSGTRFGVLAAAQQVTSGVTTMGAGYLGDRFPRKAALMLGISLGLMGFAFFLTGIAPNYWVLLGAMLLVGIGPSLYHPPAIGALSRRFPDRRGFAISLHGAGGSAGQVLGPLVAAGMLALMTWRGVLQVSLFPALLAAVLIWKAMGSVPGKAGGSASTTEYLASLRGLLDKPVLMLLVLVTALRSMGQGAIRWFLPVYLLEDLELSVTRVAIYLALAQLVGIGTQPLMGVLSDRFGRKTTLVPATAALGLMYVALKYADPGAQLLITIMAIGAFQYTLHAILIAAAMDVAGEDIQSTVVSLIYGAGFLGMLSPPVAGMIVDASETTNAFVYGGAIVLLATVILATLRLPRTATQLAAEQGSFRSRV